MKTVHLEVCKPAATFLNLFVYTLRDVYSAELQIVAALPFVIKAVEDPELKKAISNHLRETRTQITRLKKMFATLRQKPEGAFCKGMQGLLAEVREIWKSKGHSPVKDAALIAALQRVEHYEISVYGTAHAYSRQLGYDQITSLINDTFDEECAADKMLSKLAVGGIFSRGINREAEDLSPRAITPRVTSRTSTTSKPRSRQPRR